ncbi:hypothetical protein CR513_30511, partial [Mucuna pruriens]
MLKREKTPRRDGTPRLKEVINTIVEGFVGGSSSRQLPPITFIDQDVVEFDPKQNDPMVITIKVANFIIKKVLIDQGSSIDILYMIVKSTSLEEHFKNLEEIFAQVQKYDMRLNPNNCATEDNPDKCDAIIKMKCLESLKKMQRLTGWLASLSHFLSGWSKRPKRRKAPYTASIRHYKQLLQKLELTGKMTTWSVKLSKFALKFETKGAIKMQVLVDFLVEMTSPLAEDPWWVLYVDDSLNLKGGRSTTTTFAIYRHVLGLLGTIKGGSRKQPRMFEKLRIHHHHLRYL